MDAGSKAKDEVAATRAVAVLNAQAVELRAEIARLRQELGNVRADLERSRSSDLVEANGRLVLSVIDAETAAESAAGELEELTKSSQRDVLTGTPNRALMLDRMESAIAMARRRGSRVAVLFVDLDHFKQINDQHGHAAGDEVLRLVSCRLGDVLRGSDTVSRHGGDEFLVLLAEVSQPADAALAAEKMLEAIARPSRIGDQTLQLSGSIGIAVFPENGDDAATLIERADSAMYLAKRRGCGRIAVIGIEA